MKVKKPTYDEIEQILPIVPAAWKSKEELEEEQPGIQDIQCPACDQKCWISEKKRYLLNTGKYRMICWKCIKEEMEERHESGEIIDAEIVNI